jgi:hypothetical protein
VAERLAVLPTVNQNARVARQLRNQTSWVVATDASSQLSSSYRRNALMPRIYARQPLHPELTGRCFLWCLRYRPLLRPPGYQCRSVDVIGVAPEIWPVPT